MEMQLGNHVLRSSYVLSEICYAM